jgi:hypothetical protein
MGTANNIVSGAGLKVKKTLSTLSTSRHVSVIPFVAARLV